MIVAILSLLLALTMGGVKVPWTHPMIVTLFGLGCIFAMAFLWIEARWAKEPILPLQLFRSRDVVAAYFIYGCQCTAQTAVSIDLIPGQEVLTMGR